MNSKRPQQADKVKFFPSPLLTPFGTVLLGLILPLSLLGLLANIPLSATLFLIALFVAVFLGVVLLERIIFSNWARQASLALETPQSFFSAAGAHLKLLLSNPVSLQSGVVRVRLEVPPGVEPECEIHSWYLEQGPTRRELAYGITPLERGEVQWSKAWIQLRRRWSLSMLQFEIIFHPPYKSLVYPNHQIADEDVAKPLQYLLPGETAIEVRRGEGREFDSLRKYAVGDDLRRIDWKRSAAGKGLLVRVFRPETHQRINVAIDCGRRMGNRVGQRKQIDYAVDATSCLFHMAARNDDECGLFAFGESVLSRQACKKGRSHFLLLRDALTSLGTGAFESDYQLLAEWANSSRRRSLMLLITSVSSPAGLDSIKRALLPVRKRHLPLVFAVADEDLEDAVSEPAKSLTEAYMISAAWEQQLAIEHRAKQLSRFGIECIYCRAAELPLRLRYKYQELKASGRL